MRYPTDATTCDESDADSDSIARRRFIAASAGAVAAAVGVSATSGVAAAHFPERLEIDITPGCDRNPVNPNGRGVIRVAVLFTRFEDGDGNTIVFDPTEHDVRYRFGAPAVVNDGGGARPLRCGRIEEDVNGDGNDDLVLRFPVEKRDLTGTSPTVCSGGSDTKTVTTATPARTA